MKGGSPTSTATKEVVVTWLCTISLWVYLLLWTFCGDHSLHWSSFAKGLFKQEGDMSDTETPQQTLDRVRSAGLPAKTSLSESLCYSPSDGSQWWFSVPPILRTIVFLFLVVVYIIIAFSHSSRKLLWAAPVIVGTQLSEETAGSMATSSAPGGSTQPVGPKDIIHRLKNTAPFIWFYLRGYHYGYRQAAGTLSKKKRKVYTKAARGFFDVKEWEDESEVSAHSLRVMDKWTPGGIYRLELRLSYTLDSPEVTSIYEQAFKEFKAKHDTDEHSTSKRGMTMSLLSLIDAATVGKIKRKRLSAQQPLQISSTAPTESSLSGGSSRKTTEVEFGRGESCVAGKDTVIAYALVAPTTNSLSNSGLTHLHYFVACVFLVLPWYNLWVKTSVPTLEVNCRKRLLK